MFVVQQKCVALVCVDCILVREDFAGKGAEFIFGSCSSSNDEMCLVLSGKFDQVLLLPWFEYLPVPGGTD